MEKDQDSINGLNQNDGIVDNAKKDVVSHESFQTLLRQRKADQERLRTAEEKLKRLDELEANESKLNDEKLKSDGNWKALLESRENKLKEIQETNTTLKELVKSFEDKFTSAHKINAFKEAIGGNLKRNEYYSFIELDKIALNPDTGAIDDKTIKSYANEFTNKYKDLIEFKVKRLPTGSASVNHKTEKSLSQMSKEELEKHIIDSAKAGLI